MVCRCGVSFTPKTSWQRHCSTRCRHRANYDPEAQRFRQMFAQYGLRREEYERLFAMGCWLCGQPFASDERPHVEHDHETLVVRGLAHGACNQIIGHAHENPNLLRKIAESLDGLSR